MPEKQKEIISDFGSGKFDPNRHAIRHRPRRMHEGLELPVDVSDLPSKLLFSSLGQNRRLPSVVIQERGPIVNFEKVLGEILALAHWMEPTPRGDTLRATTCDGKEPSSIVFPELTDGTLHGATAPIIDQLSDLSARLAKYMQRKSSKIDEAAHEVQRYASLFKGLHEDFDVGVYNLNYDTVALSALRWLF